MLSTEKFLLFIVLPIVLACSLIEGMVLSRRSGYDWKAAGVSLLDLVLRNLVGVFLPLSIITPLVNLAWEHRLYTVALDT